VQQLSLLDPQLLLPGPDAWQLCPDVVPPVQALLLHVPVAQAVVHDVQAPPTQRVPVAQVPFCQVPVASQVCGCVIEVHRPAPGLHVTHVPLRQTGVATEHAAPLSIQIPLTHVCGWVPLQRMAEVVHPASIPPFSPESGPLLEPELLPVVASVPPLDPAALEVPASFANETLSMPTSALHPMTAGASSAIGTRTRVLFIFETLGLDSTPP
jgi:hypothetical protein